MYTYDTVSQAVNGLKQRGYAIDFNLEADKIICRQTPVSLLPSEFEITEVYRFEGNSDPADEAVVYAIESKNGAVKGIMSSAYGTYAESISTEMIQKLSMHK